MIDGKILRNGFFLLIRVALILSLLANLAMVALSLVDGPDSRPGGFMERNGKRLELIFWSLITLFISFGSGYIEQREKIDIPDILEVVIIAFIYAALFLSERFELFDKYFWWDDLLHTLSGAIIGFIGFIAVYMINRRYSMDLNPLLVALFSFSFAVTAGVLWEIWEFSMDALFMTDAQKWSRPTTDVLIGRPYQGSGLRDTMSDLIVDSLGALITSVITYLMYKNKKRKTLEKMSKMIKEA